MFAVYKVVVYYLSLALFGGVGFLFNVVCWLAGPVRNATPRERFFQRAIQSLFHAFTCWLTLTRLVRIDYRGFDAVATERCVVVANHPSLLDAVFLLARVPAAICIYKPAVRRNPVLGAAAVRAGYLASDGGVALVRAAAEKIESGATLVVFPEGTRTPASGELGAFKPGFASIARVARAPVQLVRISCDSRLLTKERACWKVPQLPARVVVQAGPRLDSRTAASPAALVAEAEAWFRATPSPTTARTVPAYRAAPFTTLTAS